MTELDVTLRDGRTLHVYDDGDPDGHVVVQHHGTPGSGLGYPPDNELGRERGLRIVNYDRAGYGGSTAERGRRVADAAAATAAVADAYGIDRFGVWGTSGGGPHALACAALLSGRVVGAVAAASLAPFDAPGLDWFAGLGESSRIEFDLARTDPGGLARFVEESAATALRAPLDGPLEVWGSLLSAPDRAALAESAEHRAQVWHVALGRGLEGWLDDDVAFVEPWGFDPAAIRVPVAIRHGDADLMVPIAHGEWLGAAIPGADLVRLPGEGHFAACDAPAAALGWLLDVARTA